MESLRLRRLLGHLNTASVAAPAPQKKNPNPSSLFHAAPCANTPGDDPNLQPFTLHATDEELADLRSRLGKARWPDQLEDMETGWEYGAELKVS